MNLRRDDERHDARHRLLRRDGGWWTGEEDQRDGNERERTKEQDTHMRSPRAATGMAMRTIVAAVSPRSPDYFRDNPAVQLRMPTSGDALGLTSGDITRKRWPSVETV